uniref:Uncharacterized protein n=1 Tax=Vannella robusta TaxID=1487602 RepID=A0A7S4HHE9_9EUKA|mmetsp:Transcript_10581/g.13097  ORF Transcript_10581/g.13097 Transcript_10581/m.13097 type:complete len:488 (+) Transcript_10581:38-1501(+)
MSCACTLCYHSEYYGIQDVLEHPSVVSQEKVSRVRSWRTNFAFLAIGMGLSIAWNSISFAMTFVLDSFAELPIQAYTWILLLFFYNFPGLPMQVIQYLLLCRNEGKHSSPTNSQQRTHYAIKITICFVCLSFLVFLIPLLFLSAVNIWISFLGILLVVFGIGCAQASAFGLVFQMGSSFSPSDYAVIPSCMAGIGVSTFLLLFLTITEQFNGSGASSSEIFIYFLPVSLVPWISIAALLLVVFQDKIIAYVKPEEASNGIELEEKAESVLGTDQMSCCCGENCACSTHCPENSTVDDEKEVDELSKEEEEENLNNSNLGHVVTFRMIMASCLSSYSIGLVLVLFTASIPHIAEGQGENSAFFSTSVMYLQAICLFAGNESAAFKRFIIRTSVLAVCTTVEVLLFVPIYLHGFIMTWDSLNILLYILIGIFAFMGSYINSCSYVLAASSVQENFKPKAIAMLNVFLYFGYMSGLAMSAFISVLTEMLH